MKNMADSVKARLQQQTQANKRPFQELLHYYAIERFLFRLSISPYAKHFILKGAMLFHLWQISDHRATRDIDFLGHLENDPEKLRAIMVEVCRWPVEDDGLVFGVDDMEVSRIKEDADYQGLRVVFSGWLERSHIKMQLDIGFGDKALIQEQQVYPTLLNQQAPQLRSYRPESVIAEKIEAMITLGLANSRMKDFFDVWTLSQKLSFDKTKLAQALALTFKQRERSFNLEATVWTEAFAHDPYKQLQWQAFVRKNKLEHAPQQFGELMTAIKTFILPIIQELTPSA